MWSAIAVLPASSMTTTSSALSSSREAVTTASRSRAGGGLRLIVGMLVFSSFTLPGSYAPGVPVRCPIFGFRAARIRVADSGCGRVWKKIQAGGRILAKAPARASETLKAA
jgi:hypothetical protein